MPENNDVMNVVFAGLGGQGIIKASDMFADAVFHSGYDVKKSEIHGMSQRGGTVTSDLRFGKQVFSPMVPLAQAQYLVALDSSQIDAVRHVLHPNGVIIQPEMFLNENQTLDDLDRDAATPVNKRNMNVALLGVLSTYLDIDEKVWMEAVYAHLPEKLHAQNKEVFALGQALGKQIQN